MSDPASLKAAREKELRERVFSARYSENEPLVYGKMGAAQALIKLLDAAALSGEPPLQNFAQQLAANQVQLPDEARRILNENLDSLYWEPAAPTPEQTELNQIHDRFWGSIHPAAPTAATPDPREDVEIRDAIVGLESCCDYPRTQEWERLWAAISDWHRRAISGEPRG